MKKRKSHSTSFLKVYLKVREKKNGFNYMYVKNLWRKKKRTCSPWGDSNSRPLVYKTSALTTELQRRLERSFSISKFIVYFRPFSISFLQVDYNGGYSSFSWARFGQQFNDKVANPQTILLWYRQRDPSAAGELFLYGMPRLVQVEVLDHYYSLLL